MKHLYMITTLLLLQLFAVGLVVQPASAQQSTTAQDARWQFEYFDNAFLSGDVVHTRHENNVRFNWGTGSPAPNVPADNFSARISTDIFFPAGTYRFYMLANDGAHLYVDFRSIINTFEEERNRPNEILTADVTLNAGVHHIQLDYRKLGDDAWVYLDWRNVATQTLEPPFSVPAPPAPAPPAHTEPVTGMLWTAQFFSNRDLSGSPSVIISDAGPNYNWGAGTPFPNMPADNFSVRWSTVHFLQGVPHQIRVRADDGVRVYVGGVLRIDQWHEATGETYTTTFTPVEGHNSLVVEFFEAHGVAFIEFALGRVISPPETAASTAMVTTGRLNVRNVPDPINSIVLTRISQNETYPVVGRNATSTWWQVNVHGTFGWVSGNFVHVTNQHLVPIVSAAPVAPGTNLPPTDYLLVTRANLNIRASPTTASAILGQIPWGGTAQIIARNAASTWWQVRHADITGWVSDAFVGVQPDADLSAIPVVAQ
jgi:uncharacterized protein YraI